MSFANLKRNRGKSSEAIKKALQGNSQGGGSSREKNPNLWYPKTDDAGNGYAVIRFLPPAEGANLPWAKRYKHGWKDKNGWMIAECPTTLGNDCPICEANKELWQTEDRENRKIASRRKRKLEYYLNILIESDSKNPENEGQVKIFRCGTKIFEMIQNAQNPEFEDEVAFDPFDFWDGASFKLKIRKYEGMTNYDKSEFNTPSELMDGDDEKLEEVYKQLHDLGEFVKPEIFKDYDSLKTRFHRVIGADSVASAPRSAEEAVAPKAAPAAAPAEEAVAKAPESAEAEMEAAESADDALALFRDMANG